MTTEPPASTDSIGRNRQYWDEQAAWYAEPRRSDWTGEPAWGIWQVPDSEVGLLRGVEGKDAIELGCGTGYVSAWLARLGAHPVGIDPTTNQLATATARQRATGLPVRFVQAAGEAVPFRDESFDLAISEYGAAIWADPYRWIPEAARVLRPGGELIFLGNSYLMMLCVPDEDGVAADPSLRRPHFGMHRFEWPDDISVEFHLPHGEWIRLFRANGFVVEDLIELQAPADARSDYPFVDLSWAQQWPSEEVWRVRKA